ncbi:hypothetical protein V8D89_001189 [Ganoderma adspersum]
MSTPAKPSPSFANRESPCILPHPCRHFESQTCCSPAQPGEEANDTDGVAALVGMTGDECLKFIACPTKWALPEKRATGRAHANFDAARRCPNWNSLTVPLPQRRALRRATFRRSTSRSTQLGFSSWLKLPENEGRLVWRFGHGMVGTRQFENKNENL